MASGAVIGGYSDDGSATTFRYVPPLVMALLAMAPAATSATSSISQCHAQQQSILPLALPRYLGHNRMQLTPPVSTNLDRANGQRNMSAAPQSPSPLCTLYTPAAIPIIPGADAAITVKTGPHETECFYEYVPGTATHQRSVTLMSHASSLYTREAVSSFLFRYC